MYVVNQVPSHCSGRIIGVILTPLIFSGSFRAPNRKLLIGKKYELEKKIEGRPGAAKLPQNEGVSGETAERIAQEEGISKATVERYADLYKAHEEIKKRSPEENQIPQNEGIDPKPLETAERIAEEQGVSRATVERSADLYKAHKNIKKRSPKAAKKLTEGKTKVKQKDVLAVGKALQDDKIPEEQKEKLVSEIEENFSQAAETAQLCKGRFPLERKLSFFIWSDFNSD